MTSETFRGFCIGVLLVAWVTALRGDLYGLEWTIEQTRLAWLPTWGAANIALHVAHLGVLAFLIWGARRGT